MKAELLTFVSWLSALSTRSRRRICGDLGLSWSRFQRWQQRAKAGGSLADAHGGGASLDQPLAWEREAVIDYALAHPQDGYRRLTWQMIDADVACLSESAVYRILAAEELLCRWARPPRKHGQGPPPATAVHQRWHTDIMYLRLADTWYFLVSFLDAYSRYLVHWSLLPSMTADEITLAQLEAIEHYPDARPEIVSDRGSQYTSKEYKALLRHFELEHILCRVAHPQSNGLIERYHRSTRAALDLHAPPDDYRQAKALIARWVHDYNQERLHASLNYLPPNEYFQGDPQARLSERRHKLERALAARRDANQRSHETPTSTIELPTAEATAPTSYKTHSRGAIGYG